MTHHGANDPDLQPLPHGEPRRAVAAAGQPERATTTTAALLKVLGAARDRPKSTLATAAAIAALAAIVYTIAGEVPALLVLLVGLVLGLEALLLAERRRRRRAGRGRLMW